MKSKKITGIVLAAAIMGTGCSYIGEETDCTTAQSTVIEEAADTTETETETEPEISETAAKEAFEFNPHLYSPTLAQEIPEDYWDSFYNMCDALRKGEDTFECSSQDAYDFCMLPGTTANLFPAACIKISGESDDGSIPYENGTGRIYYKMPVEEFVQRQADFEVLITDILNSTLEPDDNDFEKALKLYLYIGNNYFLVRGER